MGAVQSRLADVNQLVGQQVDMKKAKQRVHKWGNAAWWMSGNLLWTSVTAAIVLAIPVFFEYERECQMFEQMQQMQAVQMNQAASI